MKKYDFSGVSGVFNPGHPGASVGSVYDNLYVVGTRVTFEHYYLVRADSEDDARDRLVSIDFDCPNFQKFVSEKVVEAYPIAGAGDVVHLLKNTEQPGMTIEQYLAAEKKWLANNVTDTGN
jgi:hypothetical protein